MINVVTNVYPRTIYISNNGNDSNNGTSILSSWKSLKKLQLEANLGKIVAGDSVLFRRGDVFEGKLKWMKIWGYNCASGKINKTIYFSSYGKGEKPLFIYPHDNNTSPENRIIFHFAGVDYITIDGLKFNDPDNKGNKTNPGYCGVPIYLGAMNEANCNSCIINSVEISNCGMGIVIIGDRNSVRNCLLKDFNNLKSTPRIDEKSSYDDYGANAITITGNFNEVKDNIINGAWAESEDYGWNGGAIEFFNSCSNNLISHNTIIDCAGVAEFGGLNKGVVSKFNTFQYNEIKNCGSMVWSNLLGVFAADISNIDFNQNDVLEDNHSRFSGSFTGKGINSTHIKKLIESEKTLFAFNGSTNEKYIYIIKMNKFSIKTGIKLFNKANEYKIKCLNNLLIN